MLEKLGHLVLLVAVDTVSAPSRSFLSFETRITLDTKRAIELDHLTVQKIQTLRNLERSVTQEERSENRTVSMVEFEPGVEDHGKSITCRAENPNVTGLFVEKSWKIDVVCKYTINIYSIALFREIPIRFLLRRFTSGRDIKCIFDDSSC